MRIIPHQRLSTRLRLLIGVITLSFIITAGITWAIITAKHNYQQAVHLWRNTFDQSYHSNLQAIAANKTAGITTDAIIASLNSLRATLIAWQAPAEPRIWNLSLLSVKQKQAQAAVVQQGASVAQALESTKTFITYQAAVAQKLAIANDQKADNLAQLKQLDTNWRTTAADLAQLTPPESATQLHKALLATFQTASNQLAGLIPLYERQDVEGFTAQQSKLLDTIAILQTYGDQAAALAKTQDQELAVQLHRLVDAFEQLAAL